MSLAINLVSELRKIMYLKLHKTGLCLPGSSIAYNNNIRLNLKIDIIIFDLALENYYIGAMIQRTIEDNIIERIDGKKIHNPTWSQAMW